MAKQGRQVDVGKLKPAPKPLRPEDRKPEQVPLGRKLEGQHERDAGHIQFFPGKAAEKLQPNDDVGIVKTVDGHYYIARESNLEGFHCVGKVDPFLNEPVQPDEQCMVILYPNTITAMNHRWSHPDFDVDLETEAKMVLDAMTWLVSFGAEFDCPLSHLISGAEHYLRTGENYEDHYFYNVPTSTLNQNEKFWENYWIMKRERNPSPSGQAPPVPFKGCCQTSTAESDDVDDQWL